MSLIHITSSFRAKLVLAASVLTLTISVLAGMLYLSTERYQYHLERSIIANQVLSSFQTISDHTYRKLNAVGQIVATGYIDNVEARLANEQQLWAAVTQTQAYLEAENALDHAPDFEEKLGRLARIEDMVQRIIRGGAEIRSAVERGDRTGAEAALNRLQSEEIAGQFNNLIDQAIAEEREIVHATQADAIALGELIGRVLPVAILVTLVIGSFAAFKISRSLRVSLTQLRTAADAYTSGNLDHRSFHLPDVEFDQLATAFNRMAEELADRRAEARQSQASLEQQVAERTQELSHTLKQLELADASRRQFLADISHELRTPLTLIQGEAEMVLRGDAKTTAEYQEALTRVRDQAIQTTRLVKDLLLVARAEEGNLRMERRSLDLGELLRDVCSDFRSALQKKHLTLADEFPDLPFAIKGDPNRLRQVFAIVLDNAIRYSDERQTVSIQLRHDRGEAEVSIRNRGTELNAQELSSVFDRFFRGGDAARKSDGSGLGLPVAKAIVEAHQGTIALHSDAEGVTALVRLPNEQNTEAVA